MFQYVTQITMIPLYDSDSRCRDFYASHADLKTQFIADFVPKKQNIKMSAMSSKPLTKHPQEISCPLPGVYTSTVHMLVKLHT